MIIQAISMSKALKVIVDNSVRDKIFDFFIQSHKDLSIVDYKRCIVNSLYYKLAPNSNIR